MDEQLQILGRVEELAKKPGNNVCAECPERHTTWVSLIKPAFRGGEVMGVFVCEGCSRHHHQLGRKISEVKGMTMATKWSFKELGYVSKSGNQIVNSIYEGDEDECADDKEIITFDKEEAAKLRGDYIRKKYIERKYFTEDKFHATMSKLNSSYKRYNEVSTRGSSPRRASIMTGALSQVPSTPVSSKNRRASMDSPKQSPTKEESTASAVPETPTKKGKDLGAMLRNIKEMDDSSHATASRRAIPSSASLSTPRNGRRRSVMTPSTPGSVSGAADPYSRQRQSILAQVSPAELIQLGMSEDGSQRGGGGDGNNDDDLGSSERSARSISRRNRRQSALALRDEDNLSGSRRGDSSSRRQRHSILNSRDEDSLSGSRRGESSSRRQRHTVLSREEDSLSGSRRGENSSRRQRHTVLNKENSDRSLSSRGPRSRRESMRGSDRSHSARDVGRADRNKRRQSLLRPEKDLGSESESESERDPLEHSRIRNSSGLLPSSLLQDGPSQQQLAPVHSSLKRTTQSMRSSRTSVSIADGPRQQQSMRSARTSVVLQEPEMVESKKNLDKRRTSMLLAGERLSRRSVVDKSVDHPSSSQSMRESRTSDGYSPPRPLHESASNSSLRSSDRSRRSERSSRTTKSPPRDKDSSPSRRSKRSSGMKDRSDGSTRSRHMDSSDPDTSTRSKRAASTDGFSARSSRSKREGRTSGSTKSTSPSRRIKKSATMSTNDDAKKEMRHCRSVGALGELVRSSTSSGNGSQNFDWKAHKKSVEARGQGDIDSDPLMKSTHHDKKSDPLSKGSGHNRKGSSKKSTKVKRHNSDGDIGDSDSDDSGDGGRSSRKSKSDRKPDRRSMKKIPSSKAMSRSSSTGKIPVDSEDATNPRGSSTKRGKFNRRKSQSARNLTGIDLGDLGGGSGEADQSKKSSSSRSKSKSRKSERRDSSTADKYKNLENGVANSSYSAGSLGLLMTNTAEKEAVATATATTTKDKASSSYSNLTAASGTLGFLAQPSSSMTAKMSDVFGIKGAELKKAGRKSIVTQWMSPTDVATAAKAVIDSNKEGKDESKEKKKSLDIKHASYNDAIVAQWLTTEAT